MKRYLWTASAMILVIALAGCINPFQTNKNADDEAHHPTEVTIRISGGSGSGEVSPATVYPRIPDGLSYTASFSGPATVEDQQVESGEVTVPLKNGTWTVIVEGRNSGGDLVVSGSVEITVPNETSVTVPLSFADGGSGTVSIELAVTLPEGVTAGNLAVSLTDLNGSTGPYEQNEASPSFPTTVVWSSVPAGEYLFKAEITTGAGNALTPIVEVVRVAGGATSSATLEAPASAFTGLPAAPTDLQATPADGGVELSWTDTSSTALGYFVERSTDGGSSYTELLRADGPSTTSYLDETATDYGVYYYRVGLFSTTGDSPPSGEAAASVDPPVIFVVPGGTGSDGYSWADAVGDPQAAIDAAADFSNPPEVWVAAGIYVPLSRPHVDLADWPGFDGGFDPSSDPRTVHFSLRPGVEVYGGFAGSETGRDQRDITANPTIFSGDIEADDSVTGSGAELSLINYADNAIHVFFHPASLGLDPTARLDGVTIRGGNAPDSVEPITHGSGGAMLNIDANPTLANLVVTENAARFGGGIHVSSSGSTSLANVVFDRNYAFSSGGALYTSSTAASIVNGVFWGNSASGQYGGALYVDGTPGTPVSLSNSTIVGNYAGTDAPAIAVASGDVQVTASVVDVNVSGGDHDLRVTGSASNLLLRRSLVSAYPAGLDNPDGATVTISELVMGVAGLTDATSPTGQDAVWGTTDDGLSPADGSILVDAGGAENLPPDTADLDGDGDTVETVPSDLTLGARTVQNGPDIGAYESPFVDNEAPAPVENLVVSSGPSSVTATWDTPADGSIVAYEVSWSPEDGVSQPIGVDGGSTSAVIDQLTGATQYTVSVVALDGAGNVSTPQSTVGSTADPNAFRVTDLRIMSSDGRADLFWTDPSDTESVTGIRFIYNASFGPIENNIELGVGHARRTGLSNGSVESFTLQVLTADGPLEEEFNISAIPGQRLHVDIDAPDGGDGSSWANAFNDLDRALIYPSQGTEIWIAEGTYIPQLNPTSRGDEEIEDDPRLNYYAIKPGIEVYGGFAGTESSIQQRDHRLHPTILSGDRNGDDVVTGAGSTLSFSNTTDNLIQVVVGEVESLLETWEEETDPWRLDGVTITGGHLRYPEGLPLDPWGDPYYDGAGDFGGGMVVLSTSSATVIANTVFFGNSALRPMDTWGGDGGGLYMVGGIIANVVFDRNAASDGEPGLDYFGDGPIMNTVFYGNSRPGSGARPQLYLSQNLNVYHATFTGNDGPGVYVESDLDYDDQFFPAPDEGELITSILFGNGADVGTAKELFVQDDDFDPTNYTVRDSLIFGYPSSTYVSLSGESFAGIQTGSPGFVDASDPRGPDGIWATADDGLIPTQTSAVDRVFSSADRPPDVADLDYDGNTFEDLPVDITGRERRVNFYSDYGAYEEQP